MKKKSLNNTFILVLYYIKMPNSRHAKAECSLLTHIEGRVCPHRNCYYNDLLLESTVSYLLDNYDWAKRIFGYVSCPPRYHTEPCGLKCLMFITPNCSYNCHGKGMVCFYSKCSMRQQLEKKTLSFVLDKSPYIIINDCPELRTLLIANEDYLNANNNNN
ncbi:hypothetical protein Hokovirus_1_329 [Hokovirus HKV1]|uniref:Uncharacterized protein n=1 Tax=Hokovirus HKV1 TaxID=1977638 RepID=A0A1V0SFF6_9VIRU|nr:hypothetical protein Hokovirus_1_329 [Hokovirus HKV1]